MFSDKDISNGYMTVEAAFVVPWVVFILVWIIYLGYFEYDRCLLFQDNYMLASQTASGIRSVEAQSEWMNSHMKKQYGIKYMGTGRVESQGEVTDSEVVVSSSLTVKHPLSYHAGMIPSSNWSISDEVHADNYSFTKRIRLFRSVGRVLDGG
ncbi:MAG: hypothetical protein K5673_03125 [Lachnospiraceae bacterium]|nr:hypothetical protein [Lachnospiraceae bacterium]